MSPMMGRLIVVFEALYASRRKVSMKSSRRNEKHEIKACVSSSGLGDCTEEEMISLQGRCLFADPHPPTKNKRFSQS